MPTLSDAAETGIRVAPSAPFELMWVIHFVESGHPHEGAYAALEPLRQRIGPELSRLRGDALPQYSTEMVVLAHRSRTLMDLDMRRFFDRIGDAIADRSPLPSLRSESQVELEVARERLERMRADAGFRKRYIELLAELWAAVEPEWQSDGLPAVKAQSERWARQIEAGMSYRRLFDAPHLWAARPYLDQFADEAAGKGMLTLTPCWFGGKIHMVELDGSTYVGQGIRHGGPTYRRVAAEVSASIRTLADPTRLAILLRLAREPASVTEIARLFNLSQPTVSAHVQLLREAGLLQEKTVGRSAQLSASEEGVRRLFSNAEESLLSAFRG